MSRSPDSETDATSSTGIAMSNNSPSGTRGLRSPVSFISRTNSPHNEVDRKDIVYPTYPIIIPTVSRAIGPLNQCVESRRSRSPPLSCVSVITSGRRASSPAGLPSSSSPGYEERARSRSPEPLAIHRTSFPLDTKSRFGRSPQESPSDGSGASSAGTDSKQLKFGMERILSEDTRSFRRHQHQDTMVMSSNVPCSECVSSLLRCCRLSTSGCEPTPSFCSPYYTTLHTPRPVRPYTNMLVTEGIHMSTSDRCGGSTNSGGTNKRKRSWSRAVFSNLQRKGLEKRFQLQKYITKPDRRQLAATLGLTDAQVKVWFQNRRMKWRHSKEAKHQQSGSASNENRSAREEQGGPDSTQEPEIDIQTLDS